MHDDSEDIYMAVVNDAEQKSIWFAHLVIPVKQGQRNRMP